MAKQVAAGPVEGPWALPGGWRWERLGSILPLSYGKALKATERRGGSVPVYGSSGVAGSHDEALCSEPALIVGRKGSAGAVYHAAGPSYAIDTAYYCATSAARFDLRLGYHLLSFLNLRKLDQSTAVPSLSRDPYDELVVPVPPDSKQPALAARIDELFAEIDDGEAALARARDDLATWRKALLKAAVTGELTADWRAANPATETGTDLLARILADRRARWEAEPRNKGKRYKEPAHVDASGLPALPDGWTWASLAQIAFVSGGLTIDAKRRPIDPVELPYLRVANVQRGHLDLRAVKSVKVERSAVSALSLAAGDILLNEGGDRDKIGRGWVYEGQLQVCLHQNHVFKARPASDSVSPFLVSMYLNELGRRFFIDQGKQTTNLASISLSKVSSAPIPVPPSAEAAEILRVHADYLLADADVEMEDLRAAAATLRQSILAAAFRGELA